MWSIWTNVGPVDGQNRICRGSIGSEGDRYLASRGQYGNCREQYGVCRDQCGLVDDQYGPQEPITDL